MVVVDAMDDEVQARAHGVVGLPVEDQPVEPVLGEGPSEKAPGEEEHERAGAVAAVRTEPHARDHDRDVEDRGHDRMDPREEVEEPALEERRGGAEALCAFLGHERILPPAVLHLTDEDDRKCRESVNEP